MSWVIFGVGFLVGAILGAFAVVIFIASQVGVNPAHSHKAKFLGLW